MTTLCRVSAENLIGTWTIEATHPALPGEAIAGRAVFAWLGEGHFLVQRTHYDHPAIPDAMVVIGDLAGTPTMHYFDVRGEQRAFEVELTTDTWRYWNDTPGFAQRFTGKLDADTITGTGELSRDNATWTPDLKITYRRAP